ncbi:MAG: hypothetical protein O2955_16005 [Planctomycetota bacterium]|nr:hypothetical protein [Planctomycetota bacterium]MDA1214019.1 hypothetical protein [Planctomycetota bacterium]
MRWIDAVMPLLIIFPMAREMLIVPLMTTRPVTLPVTPLLGQSDFAGAPDRVHTFKPLPTARMPSWKRLKPSASTSGSFVGRKTSSPVTVLQTPPSVPVSEE